MNMWANNRYESFWCGPYFDSREEAIKDGIKQYEDSIYDRRIHRKMERAKRRDARKAARLGY